MSSACIVFDMFFLWTSASPLASLLTLYCKVVCIFHFLQVSPCRTPFKLINLTTVFTVFHYWFLTFTFAFCRGWLPAGRVMSYLSILQKQVSVNRICLLLRKSTCTDRVKAFFKVKFTLSPIHFYVPCNFEYEHDSISNHFSPDPDIHNSFT